MFVRGRGGRAQLLNCVYILIFCEGHRMPRLLLRDYQWLQIEVLLQGNHGGRWDDCKHHVG